MEKQANDLSKYRYEKAVMVEVFAEEYEHGLVEHIYIFIWTLLGAFVRDEILGPILQERMNNHLPTFMTSNLDDRDSITSHLINLFGHTHQKTKFYQEIPFMYHVGLDAHNCYPVSLDQIIEDIKNEVYKCLSQL